jgi:hypothetical protein
MTIYILRSHNRNIFLILSLEKHLKNHLLKPATTCPQRAARTTVTIFVLVAAQIKR